jgi:hypothetical protein
MANTGHGQEYDSELDDDTIQIQLGEDTDTDMMDEEEALGMLGLGTKPEETVQKKRDSPRRG